MLTGFLNHHQSEAIPNTLPRKQNSPKTLPKGLFAEQLSGSAFTRPRHSNLHSWLYRKLPSVVHQDYKPSSLSLIKPLCVKQPPNPLRWSPMQSTGKRDWLKGLTHMASNPHAHFFIYYCSQSMKDCYFSSFDGELLCIPYQGQLKIHTEFGPFAIKPGQIAVIPRGVFFKVETRERALGYVCENKGLPFALPELGLLGANALANPRHFCYPEAAVEENDSSVTLFTKFQDHCFEAIGKSPLNVVAWHGNLAPYTYDLTLFNTMNTVSFDHPDPSIYTVLTSPSNTPGIANLDLVLFPERWSVAQHTFRPPYFHRNIMSELMGLIWGEYDAKKHDFEPGGISIHNAYTPHGPDKHTVLAAKKQADEPLYIGNTLAFMLESCAPWQATGLAMKHPKRQKNYTACWQ